MSNQTNKNPSLPKPGELHPLHPEILENQATINLGTLGHVSHGKSTLVECLTGIKPLKQSTELIRGITIRLGYANFKVYKCDQCPPPDCYAPKRSNFHGSLKCQYCNESMTLVRHFSFVDCPGHELLMATMINGAAIMDAALLAVAANQQVPQPQTSEHLAAAEIMRLKNMVCIQTKVDLVSEQEMYDNYSQIKDFLRETIAEHSPVIPLSCTPLQRYNLDILLQYLVEHVPIPKRDFESPPVMSIVRSFDVNRPGFEFTNLRGGVAGGTLLKGILRVGDLIEIRPGLHHKDNAGKLCYWPLQTKVVSLFSEQNSMEFAAPGGLIGVGTLLDPSLSKGDRLVGQVVGLPGHMPPVFEEFELEFLLLRRLLGMKDDEGKNIKVTKLAKDEILLMNIGSFSVRAKVVAVKRNVAKIALQKLCCAAVGEGVSISRRYNKSYRLIGCGTITHVVSLESSELV